MHGSMNVNFIMGKFRERRHFVRVGSSEDFGGERIWFKVASKWGVKTRSRSRRVRAAVALKIVHLLALSGPEHCCVGKSCVVSFQWPFVLRFVAKLKQKRQEVGVEGITQKRREHTDEGY